MEAEVKNDTRYISVEEASTYSGLSPQRIYALIKDGRVISIDNPHPEHRGAQVLVDRETLDTYLANRGKVKAERRQPELIKAGPLAEISDDMYLKVQNVPLRELVAAYIAQRVERRIYSISDAQRRSGLRRDNIVMLCKLGLIECEERDDSYQISEKGMNQLDVIKEKTENI